MSEHEANAELRDLCEAVLEDRLDAAGRDRLERWVLNDPAARRYYVTYMHQHGCLKWSLADVELLGGSGHPSALPREAPASAYPRQGRRLVRRLGRAVGLFAASLVIAFLAISWRRPAPAISTAPLAIATLVEAKACKWEGGTLPTEVGARLAPGRLRLAEGLARITFDPGASVTLEGPADLELVSAHRCTLHAGRLVANVPPPAVGFVVDTPTAVLVDHGTEFGVHVQPDQTSDVQVFSGLVEAQHRASQRSERLEPGRNRRYSAAEAADFDPHAERPAQTPSRPQGTRELRLSTADGRGKDAYIQPKFPTLNSSDVLLLVKNTRGNPNFNRKSYLGFDLAPLAGLRVVEARLALTAVPTGMGFAAEVPDATFTVYGLTDETLEGWNEEQMRWADAPANLPGGAALDHQKVVKLGTFQLPQGVQNAVCEIAGQSLVDFLNADTNGLATLILVRNTKGSGKMDLVHGFVSRRHPHLAPPTLRMLVAPRN